MNDTQKQIKLMLETRFEEFTKEKLVVEYVTDVYAKAKEIEKQIDITMRDVYETSHYTGMFIPAIGSSPFYILIQEGRNDHLDIMTAFHEWQHAVEYFLLLNCCFDRDHDQMIHSKIYPTFQIYSEFSATRKGILHYLNFVEYSNMTKKERATCLVNHYRNIYPNFEDITNKYQLIIHTLQYLGMLFGVKDAVEDFDIDNEICLIEYLKDFEKIFDLLHEFAFEYDWFIAFDKAIREFIG